MRSGCKDPSRNKAEAYRVYGEHLFRRSDNADARVFAKGREYMLINTIERDARNDGWKAGIAQGLAEGKSLGLAEGSHQKALETARLMRQRAYPVAEICLMTGLTKEEVAQL